MTWWRHQMETFSVLLALCVGNSPVTGEFPTQIPVTRICDVFVDLRLNKRLRKQSRGWLFETPSRSSRRQYVSEMNHCEQIEVCMCVLFACAPVKGHVRQGFNGLYASLVGCRCYQPYHHHNSNKIESLRTYWGRVRMRVCEIEIFQ